MNTFADVFTDRQLVALTTFSVLVQEARELIRRDAVAAGLLDDEESIGSGGAGTRAYAEAVGMYLAFAVDKGKPITGHQFAPGIPALKKWFQPLAGRLYPWFGIIQRQTP
jgi:hypothetical protein